MFEVNLINSPGIQKIGDHHVISYRHEPVPDPKKDSTLVLTKPTLTNSKWIRFIVIVLPLIIIAVVIWKFNFTQSDKSMKEGLSSQAVMSEVQFFTILNSIYELKADDVILEKVEHTPTFSSISFISKNQNLLNELNQRIESEFHHTGLISGNMTIGGQLLFQWNSLPYKPTIQTAYVTKNVIIEIFKKHELECKVEQNQLSVEVSDIILEDVLEKLDGLNHTLGVTFNLFNFDNIENNNDYKLVFEYFTN